MSEREAFLTRWSRRKREAAASQHEAMREEAALPDTEDLSAQAPAQPAGPQAEMPAQPELPPVESIDAATDIRAFLNTGVPQDLTRAALRRAWSSDPAIRDFIGLSENSWDFTKPEGVPGFAPSVPEAARELLAQMFSPSTHPVSEAPVAAAGADQGAKGDSRHEHLNAQDVASSEASPSAGVQPNADETPSRSGALQQSAPSPKLDPQT
jgi:hypothetical protein